MKSNLFIRTVKLTTRSATNRATRNINFKTMFKHLSTKHLAMMAIALDEEEQKPLKIKKRIWVYDILKRRKIEGEFYSLCGSLEDHEEKFFIYFRMCSYQFNILLTQISNDITKQNTHFREAIPAKQKLAVCLR